MDKDTQKMRDKLDPRVFSDKKSKTGGPGESYYGLANREAHEV